MNPFNVSIPTSGRCGPHNSEPIYYNGVIRNDQIALGFISAAAQARQEHIALPMITKFIKANNRLYSLEN